MAQGHIISHQLHILSCTQLSQHLSGDFSREVAYSHLREWVAESTDALWGMDFPFGLTQGTTPTSYDSWLDFIEHFVKGYPTIKDYEAMIANQKPINLQQFGTKEPHRQSDMEAKTPFAPTNLWVYKQTYFGIRDVLSPLVMTEQVCVLPMQAYQSILPAVIEVCPASTLKQLDFPTNYKGRGDVKQSKRKALLDFIIGQGDIAIPTDLHSTLIADCEGDALDSVLACYSAYRVWRGGRLFPVMTVRYHIEGYVYV